MARNSFVGLLTHRYLRVPYSLHYKEFQSPKRPKATLVFIHGIGNTLHAWDEVVRQLPKDVRVIGIDLLGFGKSPKPAWAVYNAKTQARSVSATILRHAVWQRPIIVGHSLGALVAVEVARRYPLLARRLVLCSPPFYTPEAQGKKKLLRSYDDLLRELYRTATKHPEQLERLALAAVKVGIANKSLSITNETSALYMAALESSIINQTSLDDISHLKLPISILYGALDPVVVGANITKLAKTHDNITVTRLVAGHEVIGSYVGSLVAHLKELIGRM